MSSPTSRERTMVDEAEATSRGAADVMRMSALCALPVVDEEGVARGTVLDVHVVRDGPVNVLGDAAFRVAGLVVGPAGWTERLGLFRSTVYGPWLLKAITRWLGPDR